MAWGGVVSRLTVLAPGTPEETAVVVRTYDRLYVPQFDVSAYTPDVPYSPYIDRDELCVDEDSPEYLSTEVPDNPDLDGPIVRLDRQTGLVDFSPADQVATFRSGTDVGLALEILEQEGQTLPFPNDPKTWYPSLQEDRPYPVGGGSGPLVELIGMNAPHGLEAQCGNWRDWILGMKVVLADGRIAKCGSHAVKNVAGYDAQRLFVGARGSLGIIVEVTVRTLPVRLLPSPKVSVHGFAPYRVSLIHRVPPAVREAYFKRIEGLNEGILYATDEASGTVWAGPDYEDDWERFEGDWALDTTQPDRFLSETEKKLMLRTKQIFDPTNKLNPGEWGFM